MASPAHLHLRFFSVTKEEAELEQEIMHIIIITELSFSFKKAMSSEKTIDKSQNNLALTKM